MKARPILFSSAMIRAIMDGRKTQRLFARQLQQCGRSSDMWKPSGVFSECELHADCRDEYCVGRRYRYLLCWPTGVDDSRVALGIFANPSTATPSKLDPTLKRWAAYCKLWGYGWSWTVNVRAWRETKPRLVPPDPLAIGPDNMGWVRAAASQADLIVCGWGKLGGEAGRNVEKELRDHSPGKLRCLVLNKDGSPRHPLYVSKETKPMKWK